MSINPNPKQLKALQKLFNIGVDRANTMLNYLTEWPIHVHISTLEILSPQQLYQKLQQRVGQAPVCAMELVLRGEYEGMAQLIFPPESIQVIIDMIVDDDRRSLDQDAIKSKTISEVGNIIFNGVMGSVSNVISRGITYMAPSYREGTIKQLLTSNETALKATAIFVITKFQIKQLKVDGEILLFFKVDPFESLLSELDNYN